MQSHRLISLGSILVMLLIPVIGWFLIAQPQFAAAAVADNQRAQVAAANKDAAIAVAQLKEDDSRRSELNDQLDELRGSIPADTDSEAYLDGLNALATVSGVQLVTITVGTASAYAPAESPVVATAPAPSPSGEPAGGDTATPPPVADPAIVTNPLITSDNFVTIPVTLEVSGGYSSILSFIHGLQTRGRLFLVAKLTTSTNIETGEIDSNIGGFIYAIPTGLKGDPHPTSTIVKVMSTGQEPTGTDGTDGTDGATPTPTPTPTTKP